MKIPAAGPFVRFVLLIVSVSLVLQFPGPSAKAGNDSPAPSRQSRPRIPVSFEENRGQFDSEVLFSVRDASLTAFVTKNGLLFGDLGEDETPFRMDFGRSSVESRPVGEHRLAGVVNHLIGNDPSRWIRRVPTFERIRRSNVFPGVDFVGRGNEGNLEYDFIVAPGADPRVVSLTLSGMKRASLDDAGDLVCETGGGTYRQAKPVLYQDSDGIRRSVPGGFVLESRVPGIARLSFEIGPYDRSLPLVIDPTIVYSTYFGGNREEAPTAIAVDAKGFTYVVGNTTSTVFPTVGGLPFPRPAGVNSFVAKFDPTGTKPVYATYLGGDGNDDARSVAFDAEGNAIVAGRTDSVDFPVTLKAFQKSNRGGLDAFIVKLNADGSDFVFSTYLGGSAREDANTVAADSEGNVYVAGLTISANYPVKNAFQEKPGGGGFADCLLAKINPTGTDLVYSTYLGGNEDDVATGMAVDKDGNVALTGFVNSRNFPTVNPVQEFYGGDFYDAFAAKMNSSGTALVYSTFLGGEKQERGAQTAFDRDGNAYFTGFTSSPNFPLVKPLNKTIKGSIDGYVTKLKPDGSVVFSTFFGGTKDDLPTDVAAAPDGSAFIVGNTASEDFPLVSPLRTTWLLGEGFLLRINSDGTNVILSTFLGGSSIDTAVSVATDSEGNAHVLGQTISKDFPVTSAVQPALNGFSDAFIVKVNDAPDFSIGFAPATITVRRGKKVKFFVEILKSGGFSGAVTVTGPDAKPLKFKLKPENATTSSVRVEFELKARNDAPKGAHQLTFTAKNAAGVVRTAALTVTVE